VSQTTFEGLRADTIAAAEHLRAVANPKHLYATGFCMGGRLAFLTATYSLHLDGVIGFYGWPTGPSRNGTPAPADVVAEMEGRVLGIFGGADEGIPASAAVEFEAALAKAGVNHEITTYEGAPHSFFDRKAADFADASARAWAQTLGFMGLPADPAPAGLG
jgi:carboxymethylenebutenolidase